MKIDSIIRKAMKKCVIANGAPVEITYMLGEIPWRLTVEIDEEKLTQDKPPASLRTEEVQEVGE